MSARKYGKLWERGMCGRGEMFCCRRLIHTHSCVPRITPNFRGDLVRCAWNFGQSLGQFEQHRNFVIFDPFDSAPQLDSYSFMRTQNHTKLSGRSRKISSKLLTKFESVRATLQLRQFITHWRFATDSFVLPYASSKSHQTFRAISQDVFETLDKESLCQFEQPCNFVNLWPIDGSPQIHSYSLMRARNHTKL